MNYTQLTQEQRYQIYALLKMGHNQTEIAAVIGTHKSTVSRELGVTKVCEATGQASASPSARPSSTQPQAYLGGDLGADRDEAANGLEPRADLGWLSRHHAIQISHEWIYQYILADKKREVICIVISAAKRNGANAMAATTGVANCRTG